MKKHYILVALLLIGFGVVYTQAFQLSSIDAPAPDAYTVTTTSTSATVDAIRIRPSKGGDRMVIKLTVSGTATEVYAIGVELETSTGFYDLSSATISKTPNSNADLANGYLEFDHTSSGASELLTITIDNTSIWQDVDGIMVTLADV